MDELISKIVLAGLGEQGLPVLGHAATDPGHAYFEDLIGALRKLREALVGQPALGRELAYALYALGHEVYVQFECAQRNGVVFREDLFDPDIFELEMAVESVLADEDIRYQEE